MKPAHWRRPLKDGGVEFFFRTEKGENMRGQGDLPIVADDMQAMFESRTGSSLPAPEWKRPLGRSDAGSEG